MQNALRGRPSTIKNANSIHEVRQKYFNTPKSNPTSNIVAGINQQFYNNKLKRKKSVSTIDKIDLSAEDDTVIVVDDRKHEAVNSIKTYPTPLAVTPSTPDIVKRTRRKINKIFWVYHKTMLKDYRESLQKAQQRLNRKDEELCTALIDTEPEFRTSMEPVEFCTNYVG